MFSASSSSRVRAAGFVLAILVGPALQACNNGDGGGTGPGADVCAPSSIALGDSRSGSLDGQDCVLPDGRYADRFSFSLSSALTVRIDLESTQFDAWLEIQDGSGNVIGFNDDAGGTLDSRLVQVLGAGSYVVVATTYDVGMSGGYQLSIQEAADCSPVGTISVGETVSGTLTNDDCLFEFGTLADNWTLDIDVAQTVRVIHESSDFEEGVVIRDPSGAIMYGAASPGPGQHAEFDAYLTVGTYTIVASTIYEGSTGSYELTVTEPPPCSPGDVLELDVEVFGTLSDGDCSLPGWGTADTYTLELTEETAIEILLKSLDFPPIIVMRDAQGVEVAWGYDQGSGSALLQATLSAGTYEVMPTTYLGSGARGDYQLTASEATCSGADTIAFGETVAGALTGAECRRSGGQYYDVWTLELVDEVEVQIDMTSAAFDTYLILLDDTGTQIEVNDDGGSGTNSMIRRTLAAGAYELRASSFSPYATGSYQLTVAAPVPAASPPGESPEPQAKSSAPARVTLPGGGSTWWMTVPTKR